MAGSVFDSPLFAQLFPTGDIGKLFTDTAEIRAMMLVEGALARVQGALGVIPSEAAAFLHRAAMEIQIDPGALARATGENGVTVPGLVAAFRKSLDAPEYAQYLHWGATSQDISDTALMLRLGRMLTLQDHILRDILTNLGTLAKTHANTPMAARTYGQHATPTSFGAVVAAWGHPLLTLLNDLPHLRANTLFVSLSGAAGTGAALGEKAAQTRADLAKALNLVDPGRSWHADRAPVQSIAAWQTRLATALGKMAEDLVLYTQTGIEEIALGRAGASSTMPQKQNPVAPSAIIALARQTVGLNATLNAAALHRQERDGAAWFTEWLTLPQICLGTSSALLHAQSLAKTLCPNPKAMRGALTAGQDLIHAEALSFRLAQTLPRPEAQAAIKSLCRAVLETGQPLSDLARAAYPNLALDDVFDPSAQMGHAPDAALGFAALVDKIKTDTPET